MASMRDIKRRIRSVNSTKQITKAMELVSTSKLRRARERADKIKPYFHTVKETVQDIFSTATDLNHKYTKARDVKKTCYIVITADRGLCGGYNINAIKKALESMEGKNEVSVITIGSKARDYFRNKKYDIDGEFIGISEKPTYAHSKKVSNLALKLYEKEMVDEVYLVYTQFVSTLNQEPDMIKLLPFSSEGNEKVDTSEDYEYVSYEPSPAVLLDYIIPKYIESSLYGALAESSASEQAARRVAMENATDNAEEMIDKLTLTYNRARQAAITQEIAEIVGGAEALK
ncbi:ATP synthase F1 subunit gamma [Anaeromicrobium sediminis]|uniref:ATP synthase gamma chain n=1 Tax=Anaeromicrobium sediminis TaxID=1478221 RepID=A0A267MHL0_9FIRM|nr:ATP synthase F1 subunit gamma [Anaeromicrobium sediminis]PAB58290.1 ATP synthase F1 subunit gamma [Anaeromicrobium sediminis]